MERNQDPSLIRLIERLNSSGTAQQFALFVHRYHEADIADALSETDPKDRLKFIRKLKPDIAAEILEEMDVEIQIQLITEFKTKEAARYIEEMDPDDAADLLEELGQEDQERATEIIDALPDSEAKELKDLLSYEEDTAGAIMTTDFTKIPENLTIGEAIEAYRSQNPPDSESSYYIYIVDEKNKLRGYTSIRNLLLANKNEKVADTRNQYPKTVEIDMDQEDVARMIGKYDLISVPVINHNQEIVGIVTVDDVVDVVVEEASEDLYKLSGTGDADTIKLLHGPLTYAIRARLPWLFITILGGLMASFVMKTFASGFSGETIILAILLSFVPLVIGLSGNIGGQSATIIVRALGTGALKSVDEYKIIVREICVGAGIGTMLGTIVSIAAFLIQNDMVLAGVLGLTIIVNSIVAACLGSSLPLILKKLKIDPAIASAPFISTTLDIVGQIIYFAMVITALSWLSV